MKRLIISTAIALGLAGCATTEVMEYHAAPGQEVLTGKGGAMKTVNGIEFWMNGGSPPRAFRIIAEATTKYQTGGFGDLGDRQNALEQIAAEAKKRGADAVIVYGEAGGVAGYATVPGVSTTNVTGYGRTARATTTTSPGYTGAIGDHTVGALFVKYEK